MIRHRCGQSDGLQELQELEFVCCYMLVVFEVHITMLTYNHFFRLPRRKLNFKRRHLRRDPSFQLPCAKQLAILRKLVCCEKQQANCDDIEILFLFFETRCRCVLCTLVLMVINRHIWPFQ